MEGGGGPSGAGNGRDIATLIPGKNKTVVDPPALGVGGLLCALIFLFGGLFTLWGTMSLALHNSVNQDWSGAISWLLFGGATSCLIAFPGILMLYVSLDIRRYLPLNVLSEQLHVSEEALVQIAEEKGIRVPRYMVQGRALYRPEDFDSLSLSRFGDPPTV